MTTTNTYVLGSRLRITVTFSVESVHTDPTTVTVSIKNPSTGVVSSYTYALSQVSRSAAGMYYLDYTPEASGDWYYRCVGTGAVEAAAEGRFIVGESEIII